MVALILMKMSHFDRTPHWSCLQKAPFFEEDHTKTVVALSTSKASSLDDAISDVWGASEDDAVSDEVDEDVNSSCCGDWNRKSKGLCKAATLNHLRLDRELMSSLSGLIQTMGEEKCSTSYYQTIDQAIHCPSLKPLVEHIRFVLITTSWMLYSRIERGLFLLDLL